jgi:hypothetical protein
MNYFVSRLLKLLTRAAGEKFSRNLCFQYIYVCIYNPGCGGKTENKQIQIMRLEQNEQITSVKIILLY